MKRIVQIIILLPISWSSFAQPERAIVFDTSSHFYYSKTDFTTPDDVDLWRWEVDTLAALDNKEGIKAIARIKFFRTKAIDDGISKSVYGKYWTPYMSFDIFDIKDSAYAVKQSGRVRVISSCYPPSVGGDIIVLGKLILVNRNVCLSCQRHNTGVDYCRPVVNAILSTLDASKVIDLPSLLFRLSKPSLKILEQRECQQKWRYLKLDSSIVGTVLYHQVAPAFCGSEITASNTLIRTTRGDTIRVLQTCNMSNRFDLGQLVRIETADIWEGRIGLVPFDNLTCTLPIAYFGTIYSLSKPFSSNR